MADDLLICRGFELGQYFVPAFAVQPGEAITLRVPSCFEAADLLAATLSGVRPRPEVEVRGVCVVAERADPPTGWRRWFADPTPGRWLVRHGFAPQEATAVLARHGIDNRFRLSQYAANPRTLLGLERAYHSGPAVVVFNTSGLDPLGESAVQALVRSRLSRTAAIYLATPFLSGGVLHQRLMPGSAVVEISPNPPVAV